MSLIQSPAVAFSELSKYSEDVADMVEREQRVHVNRRDGGDFVLTTELHGRQRNEAVEVAIGLLSALMTSDDGARAVRQAFPTVFPWVRHLDGEELKEFAQDLIDAMRDMTELDVPANLHRILVGWRATARILADPELASEAMRPIPEGTSGR